MSTFRLHLWREWREHRATLLFLILALPLLAGLAALRLPRRFVGDPWMACALIAVFVLVVLAAVGGELLGRERRGPGLRWLERLPGGLGHAFAAKLSLHLVTTVVAGLLAFACAEAFASLRGRGENVETLEFALTLPLVALLSAWTFACSAWALRGGTAILAAGLGLGVSAYPVVGVLYLGYQPVMAEVVAGTAIGVLAGLVSAGLAFVLGGRRGAGQGRAIACGLLPLFLLTGLGWTWSLDQQEKRARIEPEASDFKIHYTWLTSDGTALIVVQHEDRRWEDAMPKHVLTVDLNTGAWRTIVREFTTHHELSTKGADGLMRPSVLVLNSDVAPNVTALSLRDGSPVEEFRDLSNWRRVGLGQHQWTPKESLYWDPFRMRGYGDEEIASAIGVPTSNIFICPGRWLVEGGIDWSTFDPDTCSLEPLGTPQYAKLLAILGDGRAVFQHYEVGLFCVDVRTGVQSEITVPPALNSYTELQCFQQAIYGSASAASGWVPPSIYMLDPHESTRYSLDTESLILRALGPREEPEWIVRDLPDGRALLETWSSLVELDLGTGERRQLFPRRPET